MADEVRQPKAGDDNPKPVALQGTHTPSPQAARPPDYDMSQLPKHVLTPEEEADEAELGRG